MLTLDYLKSLLFPDDQPDLDGITDKDQLLETRSGMGGAIELLQRKNLPAAVVLERPERHGFSLRNGGGRHSCTVSVWVMEMVTANESAEEVMDRCLARVERLYTILVGHFDDEQLGGWRENSDVDAYERETGSYAGYEMFIKFNESKDLSYVPRN